MIKKSNFTERELKNRLLKVFICFISFVVFSIIALEIFGPQVGALFGFFSKNRNDIEPIIQTTIAPPTFHNIPNATNEKEIAISGYTKPGSTVQLFVNGPEQTTTIAGIDGEFTTDKIKLIKGRNTIFAQTKFENRESVRSKILTVVYDNDKPELDITTPHDGDTIKNLDKRILVSGKANEKTEVKINGFLAISKPDNSFEFWLGVNEGAVEIKVVVTDDAGNSESEIVKVRYENKSP